MMNRLRKIRETAPFIIATNNIKYIGILLWISRINMVKMTILPKATNRVNAIPIKIPTQYFTDLERAIFSFI